MHVFRFLSTQKQKSYIFVPIVFQSQTKKSPLNYAKTSDQKGAHPAPAVVLLTSNRPGLSCWIGNATTSTLSLSLEGNTRNTCRLDLNPCLTLNWGKKKLAGLALCRTKWKFHFHFPFCYTLSQGTLWVMFRNRFAGWTWTGRRATTWEKKKNLAVLQVAQCRRVSWRNEKKKDF